MIEIKGRTMSQPASAPVCGSSLVWAAEVRSAVSADTGRWSGLELTLHADLTRWPMLAPSQASIGQVPYTSWPLWWWGSGGQCRCGRESRAGCVCLCLCVCMCVCACVCEDVSVINYLFVREAVYAYLCVCVCVFVGMCFCVGLWYVSFLRFFLCR